MVVNAECIQTSSQLEEVALRDRMNHVLLNIIRDNITSQYASRSTSLAEFRRAVTKHGGTEVDVTLLDDFQAHVPISDYDSYKPYVDKFNVKPCKEDDVVNMFSPGLPDFFAISSGTSGTTMKILPKYNHDKELKIQRHPWFTSENKRDQIAALACTEYQDVKVLERATGDIMHRIPVCTGSGVYVRRAVGRQIDDESSMSSTMSWYVVPWAATVIRYYPSLIVIHGLFFLAQKNVHHFFIVLATQFIDLIRHIDDHWNLLVSCIRDGIIPDLEGIDHVRQYLQAQFHPNPERAAELLEIGPPRSSEGWFSRVWPNATELRTICSGSFATVLPKMRSILGPNVTITSPGYISSEATIALAYGSKLDEFILLNEDIVEFLDVSQDATHQNLCQAWEVKVGRDYEPILTTRDGLWRYRLGDILRIVGFDTESGSPILKYVGRKALKIRFPLTQVTDDQLLVAVQSFSSEDAVRVQEFTTAIDNRSSLPTVGLFVELGGPLGPDAHLAPQRLFDALVSTNVMYKFAIEHGHTFLPTIRVVKAGTFTEYRQWKGERANLALGQIKVPTVLLNPIEQEWISGKVIQEL